MFTTSAKIKLSVSTACLLAFTACADNDEVVNADATDAETVETVVAVPVDLDKEDLNAIDPDLDLYGASETTSEQNTANEKLITARAAPLDAKQTSAREKMDLRQQAKDVKTEVDALCANKVKLVDPAYDGSESFALVDRDNNGLLSPAEFSIYDLANINPLVKCDKDDGTRPFVSTKALNMSADDFVRADTDGDVAISKQEFAAIS